MRSHLVEGAGGRVFIHELGDGANLLVLASGGENISVLLDPADAAEVGSALLGSAVRSAAPVAEAPTRGAVKAPGKRKPGAKRARPRGGADADRLVELGWMETGSRGRLRYTDHFVNKVAELYLAGSDDYDSQTGRGRKSYVVDQLHVDGQLDAPASSVRRGLDLARERGLIPPGLVPTNVRRRRPPSDESNGDVDPAEGAARVRELLSMPSPV